VAAVLHVEDDAARVGIDDMPLVCRIDLAVLLHHRLDPRAYRLAAAHAAVEVLDVAAVLGEEIHPRVPVLTHRTRAPVGAERLLELVARERRHGAAYDPLEDRVKPRGTASGPDRLRAHRGGCHAPLTFRMW